MRERLLWEREAQQHRAERTMRTAMIETVGQALGEYGDMIIDYIEKKIAEEVGKLRAEVNLKPRERQRGCRRAAESAAQVSVGREATAELKPRILRKQSTSSLVHCVNDFHSLYAHSGHANLRDRSLSLVVGEAASCPRYR